MDGGGEMSDAWKTFRDLFTLKATISVTDIEIGYGTIVLLVIGTGLAIWGWP
jgi:hypothetical protein